jgi:hypothetical protein
MFSSVVGSCWTASETGTLTVTGANIVTHIQTVTLSCGGQNITVSPTQNYVLVQIHGCLSTLAGATVSATQSGVTIIPPTTIGSGFQPVPVVIESDGTSWTFTISAPYFQTLVTTGAYGLNCANDFFLTPASPLNCCDCNIGTCPQLQISCNIGTCTLTWDYSGGIQGYIGSLTANVDAYPVTPGSGPFPNFTNTYGFCNTPLTPGLTVTFEFIYACFVGSQVGQIFVYYANCGAPPSGIGRKAWQDAVPGHGGNYGYYGYTGAFSGEPVSSPVTISNCSPGMVGTAPPPEDDYYFGTFTVTEVSCGYSYGSGSGVESLGRLSVGVVRPYWVEPATSQPSEKRRKWKEN